jgi:uncharacterized protein with NAD-binding domain and iron-sulfur cluster
VGRDGVEKVAVLGGGVGALTAAFELTAPELEGRYEVTVYQPGWRLGGKCASGRGGDTARIEEHGLHIWFGFYDNAFDMIQRCYDEWRPPAGSPIKTWKEAFKPCCDIVLLESWNGQWKPWHLPMPVDDLEPGSTEPVTEWEFLKRMIDWLIDQWHPVHSRGISAEAAAAGQAHHRGWFEQLADKLGHEIEIVEHEGAVHFLRLAAKVAETAADLAHVEHIASLLGKFKEWTFEHMLTGAMDVDDVRRFAIMLDFWTACVTGIVAEGVLIDGFGALNDVDLRAWLCRNGAAETTVKQAAFLQALYDLVFAYVEGDRDRPDLAAGKALQALIRIVVCYKGAPLWKMQAGMGDTVFSPLYEVLLQRGVRFEFFNWVTKLTVSGDEIATIELQPQARLTGGRYEPLIDVGGLPCWPSEPLWEQLEDGERLGKDLRERRVDFEAEPDPSGRGLQPLTLRAGVDFDRVVLGISVGALPPICAELAAASEHFALMLEHSDTVMTEGIQLWLAESSGALGWGFETSVATGYVPRGDTYSNMSQLLPRERWTGNERPAEVAYLCGTLDHAGIASQADADARVRENALNWLREDAGAIWPSFDCSKLVDPANRAGEQRLDAQFLRANFIASERYVLTRAGSVDFRLGADESGFANLVLAGDWTRNGMDGGCVEAAVTSGMQAARAICGRPQAIQHEQGWLVDDRR